jgi:hypothetical protein
LIHGSTYSSPHPVQESHPVQAESSHPESQKLAPHTAPPLVLQHPAPIGPTQPVSPIAIHPTSIKPNARDIIVIP